MTHSKKHSYAPEEWADYARGLVDEETMAEMKLALAASPRAQQLVSAFREVADLAAAEESNAAPEWAVRSVKALGCLRRRAEPAAESLLQRIVMSLTFDSFAMPAAVGTRDVQTDDRQMIFEVDGFRVDLRLESEQDLQHSVLVGQLLRCSDSSDPSSVSSVQAAIDVPILALSGSEIVGRSKTGQFGEFQADGLPAAVDLLILLDDDRCLELQLPAPPCDDPSLGEIS